MTALLLRPGPPAEDIDPIHAQSFVWAAGFALADGNRALHDHWLARAQAILDADEIRRIEAWWPATGCRRLTDEERAWVADRVDQLVTERWTPKPQPRPLPHDGRRATAYTQAVLDGASRDVVAAENGVRNIALNKASFRYGQVVAAGHLDEHDATERLLGCAAEAGLGALEARSTIRSGLRAGQAHPVGGIVMNAIETVYRGHTFRSRLEARWAAFFDLAGWSWTYEPFDCDGYIPNFVVHGERELLVEVKPATNYRELVAHCARIEPAIADHWHADYLIVGSMVGFDADDWQGPALGALGEYLDDGWSVGQGIWAVCIDCGVVTVHHTEQSYACRPCGHHDGGNNLLPVIPGVLQHWWGEAHTATRWMAKRRTAPEPSAAPPLSRQRREYLANGVEEECHRVLDAEPSRRIATLFESAAKLAGLLAGVLDEQFVIDVLTPCALQVGLGERETATTIRAGLAHRLEAS